MKIEPPIQSKNAAEFYIEHDDIFGRIADRYDLLCDLFSFGIHRFWKHRVARIIAREPWSHLLDCATGTGDIILRVIKQIDIQHRQTIVASDISPQMLTVAQKRFGSMIEMVELRVLDAHSMPDVATGSIDFYSISLGLKICERETVLQEAMRVLCPGGRLVILEASNIVWPWLHNLYLWYMRFCIPIIGWIATNGDASAYKYLLKGIEKFPGAEFLASELLTIGFEDVSFERISLGIVAIHVARKPLDG